MLTKEFAVKLASLKLEMDQEYFAEYGTSLIIESYPLTGNEPLNTLRFALNEAILQEFIGELETGELKGRNIAYHGIVSEGQIPTCIDLTRRHFIRDERRNCLFPEIYRNYYVFFPENEDRPLHLFIVPDSWVNHEIEMAKGLAHLWKIVATG